MNRTDKKYRDHPQQRKALHKWFEMIADTFNKRGMDMRVVLKDSVEIRWNKEGVKEYIWKPVLQASKDYDSTEEMSTKDIDEIIDFLVKHFAEKFEIELPPFPDRHGT